MRTQFRPIPRPLDRRLLPRHGTPQSDVLLVMDPRIIKADKPNDPSLKTPITAYHFNFLKPFLEKAGIPYGPGQIAAISASMPVPEEIWDSDSKLNKFIQKDRLDFIQQVRATKPKLIIAMGKSAARQTFGKAVKITSVRGKPVFDDELQTLVLPTLGPGHVARQPEHKETLQADLDTASMIITSKFSLDYNVQTDIDYRWCWDLRPYLDEIRAAGVMAVDVEWTSYGNGVNEWYNPHMKILTVQLAWKAGMAINIPINFNLRMPNVHYWRERIIRQLKQLLEDPEVKKTGHNFKGDWLALYSKLDAETAGYEDDTLLMTHAVDENMLNKSLNDCVRRWVPAMSGYNDELDRDPEHMGKERMDLLSPAKMLKYGCGDADASIRLFMALDHIIKRDTRAHNCYRRVPMAANQAFCWIEQEGFTVCIDDLTALQTLLEKQLYGDPTNDNDLGDYGRLIAMIPDRIKRDLFDEHKPQNGLKLTRPELVRAMCFTHEAGLKLKPVVFTKSTAKLKDKEKIPSTSTKLHLPYFQGKHPFIDGYIDFAKNDHLLVNNVRGFYKYIFDPWTDPETGKRYGKIRPSYLLHGAVTGRSSSKNPNGQNFPKRAIGARKALVKAYRAIFKAPKGHVLIEADFSQIELRVVAIAAKCKGMLDVYRRGGDIHCFTAANVMGISLAAFMRLKESDFATWDYKRFCAKAVNFGFVYGMGWPKFMAYARTEYGIVFTPQEAKNIRTRYFVGFPELEPWHGRLRRFAKLHGYVRAFDGRVRHLAAVHSDDEGIVAGAERQGINSPIQAFANDLGLMAIARINREVSKNLVRICGFVHDAIIAIAPLDRAIEAAKIIKHYMETNPLDEWFDFQSPIPIIAEISMSGTNLAEAEELDSAILNDPAITSWAHVRVLIDTKKAAKAAQQTFAGPVKFRPPPQRRASKFRPVPGMRRVA